MARGAGSPVAGVGSRRALPGTEPRGAPHLRAPGPVLCCVRALSGSLFIYVLPFWNIYASDESCELSALRISF